MLRQLTFAPNFSGWQKAARRALAANWSPGEILWQELASDQPLLDIGAELEPAQAPATTAKVPRAFLDAARRVACHSDARRWGLLYRLLWRLAHKESHLLELVVDPDVHKFQQMDKAIRHDVHKMRAFVRFRAVKHEDAEWFVAWFEPQHHIVELNAPFFIDRFSNMRWSILTPDLCAHWDQKQLTFTPGVTRDQAPGEDAAEDLWLRYYSSIFNPARVKIRAMQKEMPKYYWKNLPEAALIPALLNDAPARVATMLKNSQLTTHAKKLLSPQKKARHTSGTPNSDSASE
ncbi:MAG TPA: TIGR03915 family putative DNA repair protein [Verrucomicrobiae bacterium]|nr:TIGR03915 family putative DNA repair protein [Verrucomicrobiae bacterium]